MTGTIRRLMDKGYGFIGVDGQEKDIFFHAKNLVGGAQFSDLKEGDMVTFEMEDSPRGPQAINVARA